MSAPRPYETDPFHPLGSISYIKQFPYIYNSVPVISSMWYVQMFVYDNCACALIETQIMIPSHFSPKLRAGVHLNILFAESLFVLSFKERI